MSLGRYRQAHALLRVGTVAHVVEHHLAGHHQLDGPPQIAGRSASEQGVRPRKQLAAKSGPQVFHDHAYLVLRHAEHLRHDEALVDDRLRRFVKRIVRAIEHGHCRMQFDGVVRFNGRRIGLVQLQRIRGGRENAVHVASLRIDARCLLCRHFNADIGAT